MRLVAQIEMRIHAVLEALQTAAARQLEHRLHVAGETEVLLVLEDVERQRDRFDDGIVRLPGQLLRTVDLLEALLRRADLIEVQREHEPPNIPRNRASAHGRAPWLPGFVSRCPRAWGCKAARTGVRR